MTFEQLNFFSDTRTTQWEDPRLSNPEIAGPAIPYSRDYKRKYEYMKNQLKRPVRVFLFYQGNRIVAVVQNILYTLFGNRFNFHWYSWNIENALPISSNVVNAYFINLSTNYDINIIFHQKVYWYDISDGISKKNYISIFLYYHFGNTQVFTHCMNSHLWIHKNPSVFFPNIWC